MNSNLFSDFLAEHPERLEAVYEAMRLSDATLLKIGEIICILSAGTIVAIITVNPALSRWGLRLTVILEVLAIMGVLTWFYAKAMVQFRKAKTLLNNPEPPPIFKFPWWGRIAKIIGLWSFALSYLSLIISWWKV